MQSEFTEDLKKSLLCKPSPAMIAIGIHRQELETEAKRICSNCTQKCLINQVIPGCVGYTPKKGGKKCQN